MKTSTKITTLIIIFFLIIATVIIGRTMIGNHFKKKFSKRPPPGIIVTTTQERIFENIVSTYGTAVPIKTQSFKIEKYEILKPINFNQKVKKGEVIANLKNRKIIAEFDGVIGKREFSEDLEVSKSSILINLEDTSSLYCDVDIPEIFVPFIKVGLPVDIKFSGYKGKIYKGVVDSFASRISEDTRSPALIGWQNLQDKKYSKLSLIKDLLVLLDILKQSKAHGNNIKMKLVISLLQEQDLKIAWILLVGTQTKLKKF